MSNDMKIAVLEAQFEGKLTVIEKQFEGQMALVTQEVNGLREQHKAHAVKMENSIGRIDGKIENMLETINKGKGAFAFTVLTAGAIAALLSKALGFMSTLIR